MIKIFNANDKIFNTNGIININAISCKETKKKSLNGWYLDLQIDIKYQEYIKKDMLVVVKSKSKLTPQAFRLEAPKYNNGIIEVIANHVMFDSKRYMLYDVRPTDKSALLALEYINERTDKKSPFTYESSIEGLNTAYFELKNLCEAWEIIEERWGGIFDANNWHITFSANLGKYVGEMLVYKKNISSFIKYEDWSNVVTRIYPVGDEGLKLPEKYIDSDIQYKVPYSKKVEFKKTLENEDNKSYTEEELITNLRDQALKYLNDNKYPNVSYEVTSNINESYDVNDKILVKHPLADIQTEVQEYTYNHNKKKTENLVFGNYTRDVKSRFDSIKNSIVELVEKFNKNDLLIKHQTELINTLNKTGLLYIDDNEMLILDKLPKEEAKYVWRIGMGGFGFSKNGYEGPFETAWTLDGNFNANFIRSGKISTELIEGFEELLLKVNNFDNQSKNIAQIMIKQEEIMQEISAISDTTTVDKGIGKISLEDINESNLIYLNIYPTKTDISYIYPDFGLFPEADLYPLSRKLVMRNLTNNTNNYYELPCDLLFYDSANYDEFIYDYNTEQCYKIKRIDLDSDGNKFILNEPMNEYFDFPEIILAEGNYEIFLLSFNDAMIQARAMVKNLYSAQFVTQTQFSARIKQAKNEINASVSEKIILTNNKLEELSGELDIQASEISLKLNSSDFTSEALIGLINNRDGTSTAKINANNIDLNGYVTLNSLSGHGTTIIDGSNIKTGIISADRLDAKVITTDNFSAQNINADRIVAGTLNANRLNGGTISSSSISIGSSNYYLKMGVSWTKHPEVSGLNVTGSGGINMSGRTGISNCYSLSNSKGDLYIASNSGTVHIGHSSSGSNLPIEIYGSKTYINQYLEVTTNSFWVRKVNGNRITLSSYINEASSKKLKTNIKEIKDDFIYNLYNEVKALKLYSYDYKKKFVDNSERKNKYGFMIEDVENKNIGKILDIEKDKDKSLYSTKGLAKLNFILIKELMKKIDILEKRLEYAKTSKFKSC